MFHASHEDTKRYNTSDEKARGNSKIKPKRSNHNFIGDSNTTYRSVKVIVKLRQILLNRDERTADPPGSILLNRVCSFLRSTFGSSNQLAEILFPGLKESQTRSWNFLPGREHGKGPSRALGCVIGTSKRRKTDRQGCNKTRRMERSHR